MTGTATLKPGVPFRVEGVRHRILVKARHIPQEPGVVYTFQVLPPDDDEATRVLHAVAGCECLSRWASSSEYWSIDTA